MNFPILLTACWLLVSCVWLLILRLNRGDEKWIYPKYATIRTILGVPLALLAFVCLWQYWRGDVFGINAGSVCLGQWATVGLVFWTLFPPIWFFSEYMAVEFKVFKDAPDERIVKNYADLAAKIWAAFLALYVVILTQRYRAEEAVLKASPPNTAAESIRLQRLQATSSRGHPKVTP